MPDVLCEWAQYHLFPNLPRGTILVLDNTSIFYSDDFMELLRMATWDPECGLVHYLFCHHSPAIAQTTIRLNDVSRRSKRLFVEMKMPQFMISERPCKMP